jgi:hypothetical protein
VPSELALELPADDVDGNADRDRLDLERLFGGVRVPAELAELGVDDVLAAVLDGDASREGTSRTQEP